MPYPEHFKGLIAPERSSMARLGSYTVLYEYEEGQEDVHDIFGYSDRQAESYAREWCEENGYRFLYVEKAVNKYAV